MPRVRILSGLAGTDLQPGEERDLPGNEAQQLIAEGRAELVRAETRETPERAQRPERTRTRKETR